MSGEESQVTVQDLFRAVVTLGERVSELSESLGVVNQLQIDQIPREEHEARWKKEQQELIDLRLHIRRQTYIVGAVFFVLGLVALGVTTFLVARQQGIENRSLHAACAERVDNSRQAMAAYLQLLNAPTVKNDGSLKEFIQTAYDSAERGTHIKC